MGVRLVNRSEVDRGPPTVGQAELVRALGALLEEPVPEHRPIGKALGLPEAPEAGEHARAFMLNLYPYVSVHVGAEGMMGGEARDRVAGFWRAVGLTPPPEPDHLGALLGLWAALEEDSAAGSLAEAALGTRAIEALLWEHLLPWLPAYLGRLQEVGGDFYGGWAEILLALLEERALPIVERFQRTEPGGVPGHLRNAPGIPDPRSPIQGAGDRFMDGLLSPVRSGMILTRLDLLRAGRELGLGVRVGERKYTLRALFGQDPGLTLEWLTGESKGWALRHERQIAAFGPIAFFWQDRAQQGVALLEALASSEAADTLTEAKAAVDSQGEVENA